nr:DEAD/DEAH box helicase family protein [Pseudomonadota bacterium]
MQNILSKHLEKISKNSESEAEKGRHFEKIAKLYLEKDKTQAYDKVWHYKDWAKEQGLSERDTGIDLVANHSDGSGFCAIQCKFYDSKTRLNQNMLSSFIAHAGSGKFASFVIVDTTTLAFSDNLEDLLSKHERYSHRVTISELDKSNIEWDAYITEGKIEIKDGKTPRDDQQTAIDAVITKFKTEDRGKMIMACGTGKTFTSLRIAEDMGGAGKTVLYMVPSLALMSQTVREWKYDARTEFNAFSVCSDVQ